MKINSIYLSSTDFNSGTIAISLGLMQFLKTKFQRVAFFQPIIKNKNDNNMNFIKNHFSLNITIEQIYLYELETIEDLLSSGQQDKIISTIIEKFNHLKENYDFILIQGISKEYISSINSDINLTIAKNLSTIYVNIINGFKKSQHDIIDDIKIESRIIEDEHLHLFCTFINKIDKNIILDTFKEIKKLNLEQDVFCLPFIKEVDNITMSDIYENLNCKLLYGKKSNLNQQIGQIKIVSMQLDNFLNYIENNDLLILSGDRSDIIAGVLLYLKSNNFKQISGILLTGNIQPQGIFNDILNSIDNFPIAILTNPLNTFETMNKVDNLKPKLTHKSYSKISLLLGSFIKHVDHNIIDKQLNIQTDDEIMTPMMFEYNLFNKARTNKKHIVLPESEDDRILRATEIVLNQHIVDITLLGDKDNIDRKSKLLGLDLSKANIIDPKESELTQKFADEFYNIRKHKGILPQSALETMENEYNYFATMMVHLGYADGMVSGASHTTANTVRPALQIIKTIEGVDIVSSLFFMCLDTNVLVYGDCAINQNPTAQELAQIAISSANTATAFGMEPKIAMLSYSTGASGAGEDVTKVLDATNIVKETVPNILIDGPLQYDAAIDKSVAKKKLPDSKIAGVANVLIFPDLNTGNNTYKAVQRSSGAVAIGPVLQGLKKPVNDLSRGCTVKDIINTVAITAIQAQNIGE